MIGIAAALTAAMPLVGSWKSRPSRRRMAPCSRPMPNRRAALGA